MHVRRRDVVYVCAFVLVLPDALLAIVNYANDGDVCRRGDTTWYAVPDSEHHFLYCHPKHGYIKLVDCRRTTIPLQRLCT